MKENELALLLAAMGGASGGGGGGGSVTVDSTLSGSSTNPVQNKVVKAALDAKLAANQGAENAGKFLVVGSDGVVVPVTMQTWQGGSY